MSDASRLPARPPAGPRRPTALPHPAAHAPTATLPRELSVASHPDPFRPAATTPAGVSTSTREAPGFAIALSTTSHTSTLTASSPPL